MYLPCTYVFTFKITMYMNGIAYITLSEYFNRVFDILLMWGLYLLNIYIPYYIYIWIMDGIDWFEWITF